MEIEGTYPKGWRPRDYQKPFWNYWVRDGGRHAENMWHRRAGKDDVVLHGTNVLAHERPANYWHMLPLQNQVRKAIWEAVNPRTGKRRIDEAFPHELREGTRDNDMLIRFRNGSTWQCLGSDNYQSAIGSTPAGIVYSEWSQSNPSARGYLRPILTENNGWQVYITTPRGKNHAYRTFKEAKKNPDAFAQLLTVEDTGMLTPEQLAVELREYIATYGEDFGRALYEQEYFCSFDAAILGSYYGTEFVKIDKEGRICDVPHDPAVPVYTAWDIGRTDDTAIWWYQIVAGEIHIIDYHASNGNDPAYYASQLLGKRVNINIEYGKLIVEFGEDMPEIAHRQAYRYERIGLPHDAKAKTLAAQGKSTQEQLAAVFGWDKTSPLVPNLSLEDGIQAARMALNRCYFDERCEEGIEALRQYQREWDDDKKCFRDRPYHDWTSHPADAFRYLAVMWQEARPKAEEQEPRFPVECTFNELVATVGKRRTAHLD